MYIAYPVPNVLLNRDRLRSTNSTAKKGHFSQREAVEGDKTQVYVDEFWFDSKISQIESKLKTHNVRRKITKELANLVYRPRDQYLKWERKKVKINLKYKNW